jgi:hypothetical protein
MIRGLLVSGQQPSQEMPTALLCKAYLKYTV